MEPKVSFLHLPRPARDVPWFSTPLRSPCHTTVFLTPSVSSTPILSTFSLPLGRAHAVPSAHMELSRHRGGMSAAGGKSGIGSRHAKCFVMNGRGGSTKQSSCEGVVDLQHAVSDARKSEVGRHQPRFSYEGNGDGVLERYEDQRSEGVEDESSSRSFRCVMSVEGGRRSASGEDCNVHQRSAARSGQSCSTEWKRPLTDLTETTSTPPSTARNMGLTAAFAKPAPCSLRTQYTATSMRLCHTPAVAILSSEVGAVGAAAGRET